MEREQWKKEGGPPESSTCCNQFLLPPLIKPQLLCLCLSLSLYLLQPGFDIKFSQWNNLTSHPWPCWALDHLIGWCLEYGLSVLRRGDQSPYEREMGVTRCHRGSLEEGTPRKKVEAQHTFWNCGYPVPLAIPKLDSLILNMYWLMDGKYWVDCQ